MRQTPLVALISLCTLSFVPAQTSRIVPGASSTVEGSTLSVYPFGYTNPRCQQIWSGAALTNSTALIDGISFRMDTKGRNGAEPSRSYTGVTFAIGSTTQTPQGLSKTFANNVTSALTTVASGNWVLPAQPAPTVSPAPFDIHIGWSLPFLFSASSGNLILDITLPGNVGKSNYFVDAEVSNGASGNSATFGASGAFSSPESFQLEADIGALTPGGSLALTCGTFQNSYNGNLIVGLSKSTWGATPLPFNLQAIGAPNNELLVSLDAEFNFNTSATAGGHESTFKSPIPNATTFHGLTFFTQAYYADANANAAGLVTTHALALTIQNPTAGPETNQVGFYDSTATSGNFALGSRAGGPVTKFHGIFP